MNVVSSDYCYCHNVSNHFDDLHEDCNSYIQSVKMTVWFMHVCV